MSSLVEQIKTRLSIADVVGTYIKIDKQGSTLKARCPFHNEKTPSFFISPARASFYCFGCNKGGDVFTFVQEIEGLDFRGALKVLADRAGLNLADFSDFKEDTGEKSTLKNLMEVAATFYEDRLKESLETMDYLRGRGLKDETIKKFRLGFAPDEWGALYKYLMSRKFREAEIEKAGMIIKGERGYYDRFRNRIMFPLEDAGGTVVAFSGRVLPGVSRSGGKDPAKYINSPETVLYSKSNFLYGFNHAKVSMRQNKSVILVEGQMDLIMSHQAGVSNVVAVSGTALTNMHLQMLKRLSNNVLMAFDQDVAGFNAARRAIEMALEHKLEVSIPILLNAKDPADLVRENPILWCTAVSHALPIIDALLQTITARKLSADERRRAVEQEVLPFAVRLRSSLDQAHYARLIADFLGLQEDSIWKAVKEVSSKLEKGTPSSNVHITLPTHEEKRLTNIVKRINSILLWQSKEADPQIPVEEFRLRLSEFLPDSNSDRCPPEKDEQAEIFRAEVAYSGHSNLKGECDSLFKGLEEEIIKEKLIKVMEDLKKAENDKNSFEIEKHVEKYHSLSKQLNDLKQK